MIVTIRNCILLILVSSTLAFAAKPDLKTTLKSCALPWKEWGGAKRALKKLATASLPKTKFWTNREALRFYKTAAESMTYNQRVRLQGYLRYSYDLVNSYARGEKSYIG